MRVVLVPGFSQTPASWQDVVDALRDRSAPANLESVPIEVPANLAWDATVAALADTGGRGHWCGYSMGGRLALAVALDHPEQVDGLVLVSTTAGIADAAQAAQRRADDERLARRVLAVGVDAFLDEWLAQPLFADVALDAPGVAERRGQRAEDLAAMLRQLGTGTMPNLWPRLSTLRVPVTIVTGRADTKYTEIGRALTAACTNTTVRRVELDGGHALAQTAPAELAAAIAEALAVT